MGSSKITILLWLIVLFITTSYGVTLVTECTGTPLSKACQQPLYTDDQSIYKYDLGLSWAFENSKPTDQGPTPFYEGKTIRIEENIGQYKDTSAGSTKTEYYVEGTGTAENGAQNMWGRGNIKSADITIPNSSSSFGDKLITNPFSGKCGDGVPNTHSKPSEGRLECPHDYGTPLEKVISGFTPRRDNYYDETGSKSADLRGAYPNNIHIDGTKISSGPDYYILNDRIRKEEITGPTKKTIGEGTHFYETGSSGIATVSTYTNAGEIKPVSGPNAANPQDICTATFNQETGYTEPVVLGEKTETFDAPAEIYDKGSITTGEAEAEVTWNHIITNNPEPVKGCDEFTRMNVSCSNNNGYGCDEDNPVQAYGEVEKTLYMVKEASFNVSMDKYDIDRDYVWGEPSQELNFPNTIKASNGVFYSDSSIYRDNRHGSNDPSVSANKYELQENGSNFKAVRVISNVADADGSNGGGNALIAYNNNKGIQGSFNGYLDTELWNSAKNNYVTAPNSRLSCSGAEKCIKSLDVKTKQTGWLTNPGNSFSIEIH